MLDITRQYIALCASGQQQRLQSAKLPFGMVGQTRKMLHREPKSLDTVCLLEKSNGNANIPANAKACKM